MVRTLRNFPARAVDQELRARGRGKVHPRTDEHIEESASDNHIHAAAGRTVPHGHAPSDGGETSVMTHQDGKKCTQHLRFVSGVEEESGMGGLRLPRFTDARVPTRHDYAEATVK